MKKLLKGDQLKKRADELGIDTTGNAIRQSDSGEHWVVYEAELQHRIIDAERSIREHRLWIIALVSAIASVFSAATALVAIFLR